MKIIKINSLTIYFLLLAFFCGLIKNALIIFTIVLIHEMGHVFFIKLLGYEIDSINIYPFGGITKVNKDLNTPINQELLIAWGGIIFQCFLFLLLFLPLFSLPTKHLIFFYNTSIMMFNLIPIIPLDGSIITSSFFAKFLSFQKTYLLTIILSIFNIIVFLIFDFTHSLNNYLITIFLIYKTYEYLKNKNYIYNRFLLERYLKNFSFKNISTKKGNLKILKKDTYQYFIEKEGIKSEKVKLQEKFDKY